MKLNSRGGKKRNLTTKIIFFNYIQVLIYIYIYELDIAYFNYLS